MICKEYSQLSTVEQVIMIGKIVHAIQNDSKYFGIAKDVIELATLKGLFDNVTILPNTNKPEDLCNPQSLSSSQQE